MSIILALIIFSGIILFHELGHFLLAKKNGIVVNEFSLGMGPRLLSFEKGGTRYSLKLLPLGGSCAMLGEDEDYHGEGSFNSKSPLARISVVAAGPIFNFILAFVAGLVILSVMGYDPALVDFVVEGSPAAEAGLQAGDLIKEYQGERIQIGRDMIMETELTDIPADERITMTVERDETEVELSFMPYVQERYLLGFTGVEDGGRILIQSISEGSPISETDVQEGDYLVAIGDVAFENYEAWSRFLEERPLDGSEVTITCERDGVPYTATMTPRESVLVETGFYYNTARVKTTPLGVLKYGLIEVRYWIEMTIKSLGMLFTGQVGMQDLSGPVGVVDAIGDTYNDTKDEGFVIMLMNMLNMVILLSANLGVMNLLPIPALDGGRLVFLIVEAVRGKPIDRDKEGMVHFVGLMCLLALMVFIMFQDVMKLL